MAVCSARVALLAYPMLHRRSLEIVGLFGPLTLPADFCCAGSPTIILDGRCRKFPPRSIRVAYESTIRH